MDNTGNEKSRLLTSANGNGKYDIGGSDDAVDTTYYDSFPVIGHPSSRLGHVADEDDLSRPLPSVLTQEVKSDNPGVPLEIKVYKRRWYILIMFSMFSNSQNCVWNTWGPISNSSERVFGWHDSTIAWLNNWGPIAYILSGVFFPWLLQTKGLRIAILSSTILVSLGCTARVITSHASTATILIHLGQFLNGLAGPMAMGAIPLLSATWFPVHERVTATALATSISMFGSALGFVLGPVLVSDTSANTTSNNHTHGFSSPYYTSNNIAGVPPLDAIINKEREEIMNYMYYSCGVSWVITIIILIYFPSKPPLPPCLSAVVQRDKFWVGVWSLRKKGYFIIIALIYGVSVGVAGVWLSVININLRNLDVSESTSGWIGFYSTVSACFMSLVVGRFADYFARSMKVFIFVLYLFGTGILLCFALMSVKIIPFSDALLYGSVIGGVTVLNGAVPLMYELACELAFPTSEGSANGVLTYLNNVAGLIFLAIFSIPHIGYAWMNWTVVGTTAICLPFIGLLKGRMKRLEIDEGVQPEKYLEQEINVNSVE